MYNIEAITYLNKLYNINNVSNTLQGGNNDVNICWLRIKIGIVCGKQRDGGWRQWGQVCNFIGV